MSYLFHPHRHHARVARGHPYYHPWSIQAPTSFSASPWHTQADLFDFSQPFLSLFNDTFSQLDRLSSDLNSHLSEAFSDNEGNWSKMLTFAPKFDIKETDAAYVLEGELPGVDKENISLDSVNDSTLVLKTKTETLRKEGLKLQANTGAETQTQIEPAKSNNKHNHATVEDAPETTTQAIDSDIQMSGANSDITAPAETTPAAEASTPTTITRTTNSAEAEAGTGAPKSPSTDLTAQQPTYHLTERTLGTFQRAFSFASPVDHASVTASLKNGVLTVTVPKKTQRAEQAETRSIKVTVEKVSDADAAAEGGEEMEVQTEQSGSGSESASAATTAEKAKL